MPEKHLTRSELFQAVHNQELTSNSHLAACPECAELVTLLSAYSVAGKLHLPDAPRGWVERAAALASGSSLLETVTRKLAEVVFDSWAVPLALGVRGESVESDRRIRFIADPIRFDLRAEKQRSGWAFVAQIKGHDQSTVTLEADKLKVAADASGVFQWSGKRPPRKITLRSEEFAIELPELSWKKKQSS